MQGQGVVLAVVCNLFAAYRGVPSACALCSLGIWLVVEGEGRTGGTGTRQQGSPRQAPLGSNPPSDQCVGASFFGCGRIFIAGGRHESQKNRNGWEGRERREGRAGWVITSRCQRSHAATRRCIRQL